MRCATWRIHAGFDRCLLEVLRGLPDPRARRGIGHRLVPVVAAVVSAVVARCRSYTAIGEWVTDLPADAAEQLGMSSGRRPSESMIRRLLQVLDAEHLAALTGRWLADRIPEPTADRRRAIAVDGKILRGSASRDQPARHVLAAAEHGTGTVLAQTDVDGHTNEITRFSPLLDQIPDLEDVVVTADALHCQRDHVTYLHGRGAHWVLTVKRNQCATRRSDTSPLSGGTDSKGGLLGLMAYLDPKGEGDKSMPGNRRSGPGAWDGASGDPCGMAKA